MLGAPLDELIKVVRERVRPDAAHGAGFNRSVLFALRGPALIDTQHP